MTKYSEKPVSFSLSVIHTSRIHLKTALTCSCGFSPSITPVGKQIGVQPEYRRCDPGCQRLSHRIAGG